MTQYPTRLIDGVTNDTNRVEGFIYTRLYTFPLSLALLFSFYLSLFISLSLSISLLLSNSFSFLHQLFDLFVCLTPFDFFSQFDSIKQWLGCCLSKTKKNKNKNKNVTRPIDSAHTTQKQSLFERLMGSMARTGSSKESKGSGHNSHSRPNSNSGSTTNHHNPGEEHDTSASVEILVDGPHNRGRHGTATAHHHPSSSRLDLHILATFAISQISKVLATSNSTHDIVQANPTFLNNLSVFKDVRLLALPMLSIVISFMF